MKQLLEGWEWEPVVRALMACKGFQEVAAMTVISELGDLRRFSHPRALMGFLGLVPGEDSSGAKRRQGSITKCGNSHCRWMLVECAQHFRKAPKVGSALTTRQIGQGKEVKELSWRMQNRLHKRYVKLKVRGKNENKAIVAIARELSAFIWELQVKLKLPIPGTADTRQQRDRHEPRGCRPGPRRAEAARPRFLPPKSPKGDFSPPVPQGRRGEAFEEAASGHQPIHLLATDRTSTSPTGNSTNQHIQTTNPTTE